MIDLKEIALKNSFPGVCATVYSERKYRGSSRQVKSGENTPNAGTIGFDQKISSIRVESGCQFTGFDSCNYRLGNHHPDWNSKTWTSNVACLRSPYNNDISSWKCTCGKIIEKGDLLLLVKKMGNHVYKTVV